MPSGIKIKDLVVGAGEEAVRPKTVVVNLRMYLNRGTELTLHGGPRHVIDLGRREYMAGLRYGIEGMRVGGRRQLKISPHLACGAEGVSGRVPPHAAIRCEVELLEVREPGVRKPEDFPPGKHLCVFHPGDAVRSLLYWQFGLDEDGHCGAIVVDLTAERQRLPFPEWHLDAATTRALFESASSLRDEFPGDCLDYDELCADMKARSNGIGTEQDGDICYVTVSVMERGQILFSHYLAEDSRARGESRLLRMIDALIAEHVGPRNEGAP